MEKKGALNLNEHIKKNEETLVSARGTQWYNINDL